MNHLRTGLCSVVLACSAALSPVVHAEDAVTVAPLGSIERAKAGRAVELLNAAVAFLKRNGPATAFESFNNPKGSFVDGPYYVFVVGPDGYMHANGGTQVPLAGRYVMDLRDAAGKPLIRDLLTAAAEKPVGSLEYRWVNPDSHRVENKVSLYSKVDSYVVSVGYYSPRSTQREAQALLDRAVAYVKEVGQDKAFVAFNNPQSGFSHDDQYVFAVGLSDGKYHANGDTPQLNGMDVRGLRDASGSPLFEYMLAVAKNSGNGTVEHMWRNPATNAVETKHTLVQRVGDMMLGVGYYTK